MLCHWIRSTYDQLTALQEKSGEVRKLLWASLMPQRCWIGLPSEHFELFVMFLKPLLDNCCTLADHCHPETPLSWRGVCGLQQCQVTSTWMAGLKNFLAEHCQGIHNAGSLSFLPTCFSKPWAYSSISNSLISWTTFGKYNHCILVLVIHYTCQGFDRCVDSMDKLPWPLQHWHKAKEFRVSRQNLMVWQSGRLSFPIRWHMHYQGGWADLRSPF